MPVADSYELVIEISLEDLKCVKKSSKRAITWGI